MRQSLRCLAITAAAAVAAGGLASCGLVKSDTVEDDSTLSGKITSVRLDNGSGGATVHGVPAGHALSLHRKIRYRGSKPGGATHRIENGVLVLGGCGSRCSVDYSVDVPAGVPVTGKVSDGAVRLARVGTVEVTAGSGSVELNAVTGPVRVRAGNGRVTGKGLTNGKVDVRTSNGRIDLALDAPADVTAATDNGAVTLTVPQAHYRVTARSHNGGKDIGVPDDPSGRYALAVTTSNGHITVHSR